MEKTLTALSKRQCADSPQTPDLIKEWVAKLAVNAGASLDAKTQAVYCSLWLEGLSDLSPSVLLAAFRKTLRECTYWPVKVADIRKHVSHAEGNANNEAADQAWRYVLDLRRQFWSPDAEGGFWSGMPRLSERISQAARAAGIWRDFPDLQSLHVWAKKQFIESFIRWGEFEQDEFLLPDGPTKKMLQWFADGKAMPKYPPVPKKPETPTLPPEERLRIADQLAAAAKEVIAANQSKECIVTASDETRRALRVQAELIKSKYPESKTTDPILGNYISAVSAALSERRE